MSAVKLPVKTRFVFAVNEDHSGGGILTSKERSGLQICSGFYSQKGHFCLSHNVQTGCAPHPTIQWIAWFLHRGC